MILFVNDLTVIDFSYLCHQRGAVGESWIVDLTLHGSLNEESMVLDFALVKKQVKKIIDEHIDHKLALPMAKNVCLEQQGEQTNVTFMYADNKRLAMSCPAQAYCPIDADEINQQTVTAFLINTILPLLPNNIDKIEINLRPENIDSFYYHYSHGLKKHDGNCQRIVHGHRSKIEIFENGMKSPRLQKQWAEAFEDIYLVSQEDIIEPDALKFIDSSPSHLCCAYTAPQGYFELSIEQSVTHTLPCDTTVECIADYLAKALKQANPNSDFKVVAYEGVAKGSIAYA
ncbi:6-carboxytetrahydropterin synthase [Pseudoalteromonas ulvae]|uniref:6-carboxy-5,6,7,8-tetrahydropterin synthase n=1 Tax=Pseudoalteromonas ulvae TaxID=107327 RepID=A0A244CMF7_PSEDV|nr:6-carboxytetrahydropterin synthase [Pseudoalteromonas ulvae]OUL56782.1 hypothetical protein B1199_15530 [Pseudoalteromonas ulvae]